MGFDEIHAPPHWGCVDFISDVHLQESDPATFLAWRNYLEQTPADAIFILGDLFELWVGDDAVSSASHGPLSNRHEGLHFEDRCARVLHFSAQQKQVYFLHGNRDFLIGEKFFTSCGIQALSDPSVLAFSGQRYLLSHGDALCLSDVDYQKFRAVVRSPEWQIQFLSTPLQERMQQARQMRAQSEALKQAEQRISDVDIQASQRWMDATRCQHFIHGHTHEGMDHAIHTAQGQGMRHVLPDWHAAGKAPRGHALRLSLGCGAAPAALVQRVNTV